MAQLVQIERLADCATLHIRVAPPTLLKCGSNAVLQGMSSCKLP